MKILKANCEQIALIESMLMGTGWMMRVEPVGTTTRLFECQEGFQPVCFINNYELLAQHGILPVRLKFEYNINDKVGYIRTSRKGIDRLKEIFPDTFERINMSDDDKKVEEAEFEVKPYTKLKS